MAGRRGADTRRRWAIYLSGPLAVLALMLSASAATAEVIVKHELLEKRDDQPCKVKLRTDAGKRVGFYLSRDEERWKIEAVILANAEVYRRFFDDQRLSDAFRFTFALKTVTIGGQILKLQNARFLEVSPSGVHKETLGSFEFKELHNVAKVLDAMAKDGFEIDGLIRLDTTASALASFRSCAYETIGLQEGQHVETDFRAEFRMLFEHTFRIWIVFLATAEHCQAAQFDEAAVNNVILRASHAFYPGLSNWRKRASYRDMLNRDVAKAQLIGASEALKGCFLARPLAEKTRIPVDMAIEEAEVWNRYPLRYWPR